MKNSIILEVVLSVGLVSLGVLVLNPFEIWMPDLLMFCMAAIGLVVFGFLGTYILHEHARDERDMNERSLAGRLAFLAGSGVLLLAILVQGYMHEVDPWLVLALAAMLFTKIGVRLYREASL